MALPALAISYLLKPVRERREALEQWAKVFRGEWTLVGMEGTANDQRDAYDAKKSITSLAAVAAPYSWRGGFNENSAVHEEDVRQFDQYYARNHTLGMDCEILFKRMFVRKPEKRAN
jgi:hypothetical protein